MTQLQRLLQALPSHKSLYENLYRTNLTSAVGRHLRFRLWRHAALLTPSIPSKRVKWFSTSWATQRAEAKQPGPQLEPDKIDFSAGQPAELPGRLSKLMSAWQLSASNKGITRQYTFSTFSKAWKFMSLVAEECKLKEHHPSWSNLYNQVTIEWTTHKPEGLSIKDVEMAEFCDRIADEIREKS